MACSADNGIEQLSLKQVHDNGPIPREIILPCQDGQSFVVGAISDDVLDVRFALDAIQVFMDAIQ
jgi:hypothetical protein